ncbi:hypothetical protein [Donghicola eburneus]|uniref:hypothetical protein n=1 Tax=Donghicola eburneus TaxID=393278 RepID=UPI0011606A51|nr:hypothetical protein [Donghicola eburneus]
MAVSACSSPNIKQNHEENIYPNRFSSTCLPSPNDLADQRKAISNWIMLEQSPSESVIAFTNESRTEVKVLNFYTLCMMEISSPLKIMDFQSISLGLSNISKTKFYQKVRELEETFNEICESDLKEENNFLDTKNVMTEPRTHCGKELFKSSSAWTFSAESGNYSIHSVGKNFFIWRD